jgi:hypothetical protein
MLCLLQLQAVDAQSNPEQITVTGFVTCSMCLIPGLCQNKTRFGCTQWWVNQGASYVLVADDQHYILAGLAGDLAEASAQSSVTITGELVPIPRRTETMRPSSLLDFLRPKIELRVVSISWPSKKHHRKKQAPASHD